MRLLINAFDYPPALGGIATCGFEVSRALARISGVDVKVLAPRRNGSQTFDLHGFFETRRISLPDEAVRTIPSMTLDLRKELARFRPDAVIDLLWMPSAISSYFALAPKRYVYAHAVELLETKRNLKKRLRRMISPLKAKVFKTATGAFAVSDFTANLIVQETGLSRDRITVIHNGVDVRKYFPRRDASRTLPSRVTDPGSRFLLLTVSRLDAFKGIDTAIQAVSRLVATGFSVFYLIVGDGPDRSRLESLVREKTLQDYVFFTGAVPESELAAYYRAADCFLLLSNEDYVTPNVEGFGIVFLEAAASGIPSIGARSGGIPDAVLDGETGILVEPGNAEAAAAAIRLLMENPERARSMGLSGRARAEEKFQWSHIAQRIVARIENDVRN